MSARMAAATGEERWIERFREASPRLQAAIEEALSIATPEVAAALVATTQEAGHGLLEMQNAAFHMIKDNDKAEAVALLEGTEYNYLEAVYQSGIEQFGEDLAALTTSWSNSLNRQIWIEGGGFTIGLILIFASIYAKFGHARLSVALAETSVAARTDLLTGLPNRRKLFEVLQTRVAACASGSSRFAFFILDVDRFKAVNDAHGHPAGDDLLQSIASRLQSVAQPGDMVARIGGDEFAMISTVAGVSSDVDDQADVQLTADRLLSIFTTPFKLNYGISIQIGTSIGVAVYDRKGDAGDLVGRADMALYRAKTEGRNHYCVFDSAIGESARKLALLETSLREAIKNDALVPYFQPLLNLQTGRLVSFEMLARWPASNGQTVSPAEFIPIAERIGLMDDLTEKLLRKALSAAVSWPRHISLACNVSPLLLKSSDFQIKLCALLIDTKFPASRLELEITESALLEDLSSAGAALHSLKSLGVSLALDDFGTGYSSLRHLHSLPFDKLKIDAGFVINMTDDLESRAIVTAVIGLAQNLGLVTVAEGVETQQAAELLRELGCDLGQGWFFGRPVPTHDASALSDLASKVIVEICNI